MQNKDAFPFIWWDYGANGGNNLWNMRSDCNSGASSHSSHHADVVWTKHKEVLILNLVRNQLKEARLLDCNSSDINVCEIVGCCSEMADFRSLLFDYTVKTYQNTGVEQNVIGIWNIWQSLCEHSVD